MEAVQVIFTVSISSRTFQLQPLCVSLWASSNTDTISIKARIFSIKARSFAKQTRSQLDELIFAIGSGGVVKKSQATFQIDPLG